MKFIVVIINIIITLACVVDEMLIDMFSMFLK